MTLAGPEHVAILTTSYPREHGDASGHFVQTEATALAERGHRVTVFTAGPARVHAGNPHVVWLPDGDASGWPGLVPRLREHPFRAAGLAAWMFRARRELGRRGPFARVIAHWLIPSGIPIALTAPLSGAALEIVLHGSDARLLACLPPRFSGAMIRALAGRGASFRCVSQQQAAWLQEAAPGVSFRVRVKPAPIDVRSAPTRAQARARLCLASGCHLVLVVGRVVPGKRIRDALEAAALVANTEVAVIGDGPELDALRAAFPGVRWLGRLPRDHTLAWIAAADVLLSASRDEGAPTAIREARLLGVPVVARACGDLESWAASDPGLSVIR